MNASLLETHIDPGVEGYKLYEAGDWERAEPLLRQAIEAGDIRFLIDYSHICTHNQWYDREAQVLMLGAVFGDADCYAFVGSISEALVKDLTRERLEERATQLLKMLNQRRAEAASMRN